MCASSQSLSMAGLGKVKVDSVCRDWCGAQGELRCSQCHETEITVTDRQRCCC